MPNDVFIAYKNLDIKGVPTRDSEIASDVYRFLATKGLKVFFSPITLENLGTSAYKKAIDEALDSATVLVAIGTSADYLNSTWVRYEWDSFYNDILSGIKPNGEVFTYIEGMMTRALPRALRQTQTFTHSPDSLRRLYNFIVNALPAPESFIAGTDYTKNWFNEKSGRLDIRKVAEVYGFSISELARMINVDLRTACIHPDSPKMHKGLIPFEKLAKTLGLIRGSIPEFRKWLRTPNAELHYRTPLEMIHAGEIHKALYALLSNDPAL